MLKAFQKCQDYKFISVFIFNQLMANLLLEKNGKTIYWRKLTCNDFHAVEKLIEDYSKNEPLASSLGQPLSETVVSTMPKVKVSRT